MDKTTPHGEALWYAVSTRSRQENVAASMLAGLGIRYFHPLITEVHRWSDRKKTVSRPLFPCYLFVHIARSCETQLRVLKVPGIVKFVGNAHGPTAIPEEEIDSVRAVLSSGIDCIPHPFFQVGRPCACCARGAGGNRGHVPSFRPGLQAGHFHRDDTAIDGHQD